MPMNPPKWVIGIRRWHWIVYYGLPMTPGIPRGQDYRLKLRRSLQLGGKVFLGH